MSYQTLVQGDRIAFATQQGASLNQIAIITTDIPSRSTIYFGPSNIFRQDGTIDATQAVMAIDVFNKTVRVGTTYISSGGGIVEADLVSTTVALLAGAGGSSDGLSVLQLTSTVIGASATSAQLNNTLTSTVTGQFVSFSPALQAGLSTLGLFTSNTSNYYKNNLVNYSTTISSISTSVGATSNWSRGAFQDWSTPVSSVSTAAGQTSNWSRGTLQNWSTSVSTVALFTSNTSNWAANIQQNWSSAVSIATLYTSNTSNWSRNLLQDYSTPVSTVALYTSNTSNWAANIQQNWSSAVSTATLFTSNTSNWSRGTLQDYSTAVSTVALFTSNSSNYFMANAGGSGTSSLLGVISSGFSTIAFFTSNTSNYFLPALSNNYSTNLQSTVAGLGTAGYISTATFLSSMIGLTSNISSMIDPIELASSIVGLGTVGFISSIGLTSILNSTVRGLDDYIASMIDPQELTSSIVGLGTVGFISSIGLDAKFGSTLTGINTTLYSTTSGTSTQIANVYQYSRGLLQDYSTPVSTVSTTAGQTSNWSRNLLQDYSTPVSTVFFYSRNLLQDFSTPVSSVGLFTSNTSNYAKNILQDWSTPVNTLNLFTQNTSNYAKNILQDWSTPVSTVALYTSNTSNWASNIQQNWSSAVSVATLYTSNTSNWAKNAQQDWSTPVSTVALYASNTSNWASNIQQNWSSAVSIATLYTSNTSNWSKNMLQDYSTPISSVIFYTRNILQDWSTPVSSISTTTGQTSNWSKNMLQDYSTPISSVIFYTKNILQDWSTPVSSISTTTGQSSNWSRNMLQDYSTPISSVIFYTKNILQDWSTSVSSVSTAAGATSNWSRGAFQDWSTPVSSLSTYTGTTSNWSKGILQDWSTPVNTVTLYTQNTSNWAKGMLVDWSTPLSTATLYTSNTSNFLLPALSNNYSTNLTSTVAGLGTATYISASQLYSTVTGVIFNGSTNTLSASRIFTSSINVAFVTGTQGFISSLVVDSLAIGSNSGFINMGDIITTSHSTLQINTGLFTATGTVCTPQIIVSSINGQTLTQLATVPIQSTVMGLATAGYISSTQLASTQAYLLAVTSTGLSSVALFTSNTSNYAKGIAVDWSTPVSSVAIFTSNTSNYFLPALSNNYSTNLQSTVDGLATAGYISSGQFLSSMLGLTSNISSMIDPVELASSIVGLGTVGFVSSIGLTAIMNSTVVGINTYVSSMIDPVELTSTITGLGASGFISTVGLDAKLASTVQGLGSATYISAAQLYSTVAGIGAMAGSTLGISTGTIAARTVSSVEGYISSFRTDSLTVGGPTGYVNIQDLNAGTISTGQLVAGAGFISSLQINTLSFGPSGYIIVSDVIANSLSTKKLNTQNLYANNVYVGNNSTQSAILFPGIDGAFKGTAIAEQTTGVGTEELLLYKVSTTTDQIRLQTTGNLVFEAGVSARSFPSTQMAATPTLFIQGSTSNVGVGTAAPQTTLDVAGTGRFVTVSTLNVNLSTINGQTITQLIATPLQSTVVGLGSAGYISSAQLLSTQAYLLAVTSTGLSTVALFTSNTSNYARNILQDWSTPILSTTAGLGTATYISAAQLYSTVTGVIFNGSTNTLSSARIFTSSLNAAFVTGSQGYISSLVVDSLAIGSNSGFINMGDIITTSHSSLQINTGILTASGTVCTPQIIVSSINGAIPLVAANITSSITGLGTVGYISSSQLASTQALLLAVTSTGLSSVGLFTSNTSNWARNLLQDYSTGNSTVSLFTSNTSNYAKGILQDFSTGISSVSVYASNTSNFFKIPASQDISTPISSLSTLYGTRLTSLSAAISTLTLQNFTSLQGSVSSLQVNSLLIGTGTGSINLGDTVMTAVSSVSTATNTLYALNTLLGNVSSQTAIQFYGLTGQFNGAVVAEKLVSPGVQELLLYKASSIQDQIRLQTTGNIVFEAGVASRSWSTSTAAATPTLYISYLSNVGIGTAAPATTLDVAGTGRFQGVSTLQAVASSFRGDGSQLQNVAGLSTVFFYSRNILQDWSTPVSSISTTTGASSNWSRNLLQDFSTPVSTVFFYSQNILQDWSTPVSSISTTTGASSNWSRNLLQDISTPVSSLSTLYGFRLTSLSASISSLTIQNVNSVQGYISSLVVDSLAIGSNSGFINMGDIITTSHSTLQINTGIFTASGTVCTPQVIVSSINGAIPLVAGDIRSSLIGLATFGYISSSQLLSSMLGMTSNISSMIDPVELTSSILGLGTVGFVSAIGLTAILNSTVIGVNTYVSSMIDPQELTSSIVGLGTIGFTSTLGLDSKLGSTFTGLATGGYISSSQLFSTVTALTGSTLSLSTGSVFASSIQALRMSTAQAAVCTVTFQDQLAGNPLGNVYQYSSILYYNNFVVAGTTAMNIQNFTF